MNIWDLLANPSNDNSKNGIAVTVSNCYQDGNAISDPYLRELNAFMQDNAADLDGYMTNDEFIIAQAIIKLAMDTENYVPSDFVATLANYIRTKAETLKYNAQDLKAALSVLG
jgi:hypothetical protein